MPIGKSSRKAPPQSASRKALPQSASHKALPQSASHAVLPQSSSHEVLPQSASHEVFSQSSSHEVLSQSSSHEVLPLSVQVLRQELINDCPEALVQFIEVSEDAIIFVVNGIQLLCIGHNKALPQNFLLVAINSVPIYFANDEDIISYIKRISSVVVKQLNWQVLVSLFQKLPSFDSIDLIYTEKKIQVGVKLLEPLHDVAAFDGVITIEGGKSIEWRGSPKFCVPWVQPHTNPALAQIMTIASDVSKFSITIKTTDGGYASVHDYDGVGSMLVLSSSIGVKKYCFKSTTDKLSLDRSNNYLMVIKPTGTEFDGEIEQMLLRTSTKIYVPSGEYPIEQYKLLDELLLDAGIDFRIHIKP